jgi:Fe-S cluster assembly protein SufD
MFTEAYLEEHTSANPFLKEKAAKARKIFTNIKDHKPGPDETVLLRNDDIKTASESPSPIETTIENQEQLKEKGIIIGSFEEIAKTHPKLINTHLMSIIKPEENKLAALHFSIIKEGTIIYIPQNITITETIKIKTHLKAKTLFKHMLIIAEKLTEVSIIEEITADKETEFYSNFVEITVQEGANVMYGVIQSLPEDCINTGIRRANVQKNANMNFVTGDFGSKTTRTLTETCLVEDGSSSTNYGFFFGKNKQKYHFYANTLHDAQHTNCDMATRGALENGAESSYRGLVNIPQHAQHTRGYQKTKTMLLSKDAIANAIPSLEIDNCHVRASHEATVGQIDKEKLFYMMSRGMNEEEARSLLVRVFFAEILKKVKNKYVNGRIQSYIDKEVHCALVDELEKTVVEI